MPHRAEPTATWVLLRGLSRGRHHWGDFTAQLQHALPHGSRVCTPDLPGNGDAFAQTSPYDVAELVQACRLNLRAQSVAPPYHVLAMSLGAMVAVAWAHAHPQELLKGVLINTSLRPFSPFWQRLQPGQYATVLRLLATRPDAWALEEAVLRMTTRHPAQPQTTLHRWVNLRDTQPVRTGNALRQLWAAMRYRAPELATTVPLLLLAGQGDALVNPRCSQALAARWGLPLLMHPTAGHDLPLDAGPWVVQQVLAWQAQAWQAAESPHR